MRKTMNRYTRIKEPLSLKNKRKKELELISDSLSSNSNSTLSKFNFSAYKISDVRKYLKKENHNKCCYCGSILSDSQSFSHIEHYRPKRGNNSLQLNTKGLGYYWLAAEWSNLCLSCSVCNNAKGTKFPLSPNSKRFITSRNTYFEEALLINYTESDYNPEEHFEFLEGEINGLTQRAEKTILTCKLFRDELVSVRKTKTTLFTRKCRNFLRDLERTKNEITNETIEYRKEAFEALQEFFKEYLKNFPNNKHEFAILEQQILRKEIIKSNKSISEIISLLNREDEKISNF